MTEVQAAALIKAIETIAYTLVLLLGIQVVRFVGGK